MTQAFSLTGTSITPQKGQYALLPNLPQEHNVEFYSGTSTDTLPVGAFVKLYGSSTSTDHPVAVVCAVTDVPYGMVVYDVRKPSYKVGERFAIAKSGDVVWCVAESAVDVGDKLQFTTDWTVDDTTTSTYAYIGKALTKATAKGDLVQVELNFNLGVAE